MVTKKALFTELIGHNVGHGLRVCRRARSAAVDVVGDSRELVGDAVCDIGAGGRARICADNHAVLELHRHDGRASAVLGIPVLGSRIHDDACKKIKI